MLTATWYTTKRFVGRSFHFRVVLSVARFFLALTTCEIGLLRYYFFPHALPLFRPLLRTPLRFFYHHAYPMRPSRASSARIAVFFAIHYHLSCFFCPPVVVCLLFRGRFYFFCLISSFEPTWHPLYTGTLNCRTVSIVFAPFTH